MNFIPLGDQNPLNHPDGQARVLNVVLEQLCVLRAEVGAVQGTLMMVGSQVGLTDLVKTRIELRRDFLKTIHDDITAAISGARPSNSPPPG